MSIRLLTSSIFTGLLLLIPCAAFSDHHEFTVGVLPDTQTYTSLRPQIMEAQIDWITTNRVFENIVYVAHLGDLKDVGACTNATLAWPDLVNPSTEWQIVSAAFNQLDIVGIPYGVTPGNHDFDQRNGIFPTDSGGCPNYSTQRPLVGYNGEFPPSSFPASSYGTRDPLGLSNEDNFTLVSSNGIDLLFINLGYQEDAPAAGSTDSIDWAETLLNTYPNHLAIFTSHFLGECNASTTGGDAGANGSCDGTLDYTFSTYADNIVTQLRGFQNLFMLIGGHRFGESYVSIDRNTEGFNPVHVVLANYQHLQYSASNFDTVPIPGPAEGSSGYFKLMRFDMDSMTIDLDSVSPSLGQNPGIAGGGGVLPVLSNGNRPDVVFSPRDIDPTVVANLYDNGDPATGNPTLHTQSVSNLVNISFAGYANLGGPDIRPDDFFFTDITDAALNTAVTSDPITVAGIDAATDISISGGEYSIDGGIFTSVVGTINNGQSVQLRQTSSNILSTQTDVTLNIGGVNDTFSVTTRATPPAPNISVSASQTTLNFTWADISQADHYYLLQNPDGVSGFTRFGGEIPAGTTGTTLDVSVHLLDWGSTQYLVEACNAADVCTQSATVGVADQIINAIAYAKSSNTETNDSFGVAVALSGDGNTLAIGASSEASAATGINGDQTDNSALFAGAIYVFTRTAGIWAQQAYIKASNTEAFDSFGLALGLSEDGNTLVVGTFSENSAATGINGDQTDNSAQTAGAAYVFTRTADTWSQQAYIKASNTTAGDYFGGALALSADGDTLAVGAQFEDGSATGVNGDQADRSTPLAGAVYVFTRAVGAWSQQAYVKASNPGVTDFFGTSVVLSGDGNSLAVGAPGERSAATGINGDQADNSANSAGAVYLFARAAGAWTQQAYVKASNTDAQDRFGRAVALNGDGDILAVGAYMESSAATGVGGDQTNNSVNNAGAVYIFSRSSDTWSQQAYVKASNPDVDDWFGQAVALSIDGNILAAGAYNEDSAATGINGAQADNSAADAGAVYVFTRAAGSWSQQAYVKASNTDGGDFFGEALAISGDGGTLVVGAAREDSVATGVDGDQSDNSAGASGAVYLY